MNSFILNKTEHICGNRKCLECYRNYPVKCVCGGLIHAQFIRENWQNVVELSYGCDKCGDKYRFPVIKVKKYKPRRFNNR